MDESFQDWAVRYAERFGLTNDVELKALLSWEDSLAASIEELDAATAAIAGNVSETIGRAEGRFSGKMVGHLQALQNAIRTIRSVRYEKGEDKPADKEWGSCAACSHGWILVPHPDCIRNGEWVPLAKGGSPTGCYYTMTITCHCGLGRWVAEHRTGDDKRSWTLERYSKFNPRWKEQMNRRRKETEHFAASLEELNPMPDKQKAVVRRILEAVFQKENERSNHAPQPF